MKDVANLAEVSFKTVSRVVNLEAGVSATLVNRVNAAIDDLGYEPDHGARTLRRRARTAATIGFIHTNMANPFFAEVHSSFEEIAAEHSCLILSGSAAGKPERQDALVRAFAGRRVDGLAVVPVGDADATPPAALIQEIERGTPVVFIDREPGIPGDVVLSDHRGGAQLATEHLLSRGHRRVAFLGSRERVHSARERRAGFEQSMSEAECRPAAIITDLHTPDESTAVVRELFSRSTRERPTALFAAQNGLTLGAVRALHQLDLHREIALVGFDDVETADIVEPGVTTVPQNAAEVGRRAGQLLFSRLLDGRVEPIREIVPVDLVERGSGEIEPLE